VKKKTKFLTAPYGAYFNREVPRENEELTHVGPGTPCGEYLRRFWHPVATSSELGDLPVPIRIMGEDLVVFRDRGAQVGLLQRHCTHRGTSLEYGIVSERGIRCCYHGWLYDVDGRILETPGEPPDSTLKDRLCQGAYPTHEHGGLIFAYFGPPDRQPAFPIFDTFVRTGDRLVPRRKLVWPCNWLQVKENNMDPIHVTFLHSIVSTVQFTSSFTVLPELDFLETPTGMICIATRRADDRIWVRINDCVMPNMHQNPPEWETAETEKSARVPTTTYWVVPVDDTHTMILGWAHLHDSYSDEIRARFGPNGDEWGLGLDTVRPQEEQQRAPRDYEAQVSQRAIAIHDLEHLASTDRGVIMFRKLVREGIRAVKDGRDLRGPTREANGVIPTLVQDTIVRVPSAATPEADRQLLRRTALKIAAQGIAELERASPATPSPA
jgi:phenylpropionate dioxygenase-like ring-hydroxylating dioxygenase large terminal subunit